MLVLTKLNWNLPSVVAVDFIQHILQVRCSEQGLGEQTLTLVRLIRKRRGRVDALSENVDEKVWVFYIGEKINSETPSFSTMPVESGCWGPRSVNMSVKSRYAFHAFPQERRDQADLHVIVTAYLLACIFLGNNIRIHLLR